MSARYPVLKVRVIGRTREVENYPARDLFLCITDRRKGQLARIFEPQQADPSVYRLSARQRAVCQGSGSEVNTGPGWRRP